MTGIHITHHDVGPWGTLGAMAIMFVFGWLLGHHDGRSAERERRR